MTKFQIILLTGISVLATPIPALAQQGDDVVVMRRVIAPKTTHSPGEYIPVDGVETSEPFWAATSWNMGPPACKENASGTRSVACISNGSIVGDSECSGPKPTTSIVTADYRTCEYDWRPASTGPWDASCAMATRDVVSNCTRKADGLVVSDNFCIGEKPSSETKFNSEGCTYSWQSKDQSCPATYQCTRSDGGKASDSLCTSPKPSSDVCGFSWKPSEWVADNPGCGSDVPQSRTLSCVDSNGETVANSMCQSVTQPETTRIGSDFSACSFSWAAGEWYPWSSECSATAKRERAVTCMRSDGESAPNDSSCAGERPVDEEIQANYSGCTFDWSVSGWSSANGCSADVTRTRTVTCRRSDGSAADESLCTGSKPESTEQVEDYSSCSYNWKSTPFVWSSTCSDNATGTRSVTCHRSDNDDTLVEDSLCDAASRPDATDVRQVVSGCSTEWIAGEWSAWSSTCSEDSTRYRSAECIKALPSGPASVDTNQCNMADRPILSETAANFSSCAPYWEYSPWGWNGVDGAKSSTCSATPQQNRTASCKKINTSGVIETVPDNQCNAATKQATTNTLSADYSSCSYSWSPDDTTTGWGEWSSACSSSATRTRTVNCMRNGTAIVDDNLCGSAGPKPATSQTGSSMGGCTNIFGNPSFEDPLFAGTLPPAGMKSWFYYPSANVGISSDAYSGSRSVFLNNNGAYLFGRNLTSEAITYGFSMMCKSPQNAQLRIDYSNPTRGNSMTKLVTCGPAWTLITFDVSWSNAGAFTFEFGSRVAGAQVLIDDVSLIPK